MAVAGLATQAVAIGTGRDFAFGLIPAFDPAGTRNLQAWFVSAALAVCAGVAALAAAYEGPGRAIQSRGWLAIMWVCLVWSAQRLTSVAALWTISERSSIRPEFVSVAAGAIICSAVVGGGATDARRRLGGLLIAMMLFVAGEAVIAAAGATGLVGPWARAIVLQSSRLLEAVAAGVFVVTVVRYLQSERGGLVATSAHASPGADRRAAAWVGGPAATRVARGVTSWIGVVLAVSLGVALAAHPADNGWWNRLLFVDFEGNLPTWFSVLLLLMCSVPALTLAALSQHAGDRRWKMWALVAVTFVILSADEGASLHELMVTPLRNLVGGSSWLRYPLIVPGSAAVIAAALIFGRFIQSWPSRVRRLFLAGGALFLTGALVVETVGGWFDPVVHGPSITYLLLATLEEGCEMIGATIMLHALLEQLALRVAALQAPDADVSGLAATVACART